MDHSVDLTQLQSVVAKYVSQYNLVVAAGPMTAAAALKAFTKDNKLASLAVVGGGVWFAVQEISGPMLKLIQDQFGYLQSLLAMVK
jgi:hypothetical protein